MKEVKATIQSIKFINCKMNNYITGDNIKQSEIILRYKDLFICDLLNE